MSLNWRIVILLTAINVSLVVVCACSMRAPSQATEAPQPIDYVALKNVTIIDGRGSPPLYNQVVVLKGDRIHDTGASDGYSYPEGARVIDLSGRYLLPGLIDMHAHVTILPVQKDGALSSHYDRATSERVLEVLLNFGITTVRNPSAPTKDGLELREKVRRREIPGPRILTAGSALQTTQSVNGPFVLARTPKKLRDEVKRQANAGVDFIKVYASMPPDLLRVVIEEAHAKGVRVIGHLQGTTWTDAARMGIDAITHGAPWAPEYLPERKRTGYQQTMKGRIYWIENLDLSFPPVREMIADLAKHRVTVDPTLIAYHTKFWGDDPRYLDHPEQSFAPRVIVEGWRQGTFTTDWAAQDYRRAKAAWPKILALTKMLYDGGVLLTAGSDLPNPWVIPGVSLHEELSLLAEAKIPTLEVIRIATYNGAVALGLEQEIGSVEVGKRADLIVLKADPLTDIKNTRSIEWVILGGKFLKPEPASGE